MRKQAFLLLSLIALVFAACSKDEAILPVESENYALSMLGMLGDEDPCGTPISVNFLAGQNIDAGDIIVYNTEEFLIVSFTTADGWVLGATQLFAGYYDDVPLTQNGSPQIGLFPHKTEHDPFVTEFTYAIPLEELDECFTITAHAEVHLLDDQGTVTQSETAWAEGDKFPGDSWAMYFEACEQPCLVLTDPVPCDEQLRTQTQGGWGSTPNGGNPGAYLHAHFAEAFPDGLTIGCDYTVTFSSAQAVTDYLPAGGPAKVLTDNYTDPGNELKNVLVGQLTALSLSLGFDAYDADFGSSSLALADMYISAGDFEGLTVAEVVSLANEVLGGCNTDYTAQQINEVLDLINNNYVDGDTNEGFLFCAPGYNPLQIAYPATSDFAP